MYRKHKFFCIGLNKTGTTSVEKALKDFGFIVDDQNEAHRLMYNYEKRDFKSIINYCKRSEAFQDSPFSMKYTFLFLHQAYPNAKFILTVRDSPEEWYYSLVNFHTKLFGINGAAPTKADLKKAQRPYGRTVYSNFKMRFNTPDNDLYNKYILIKYYKDHYDDVVDYFRLSINKLLVLNLKEKGAYQKLCQFVDKSPLYEKFPWENKT